jgi:hypothetical protein
MKVVDFNRACILHHVFHPVIVTSVGASCKLAFIFGRYGCKFSSPESHEHQSSEILGFDVVFLNVTASRELISILEKPSLQTEIS